MAATVTFRKTIQLSDTTQATEIVRGTIALSGNYPGPTGDPLNLGTSKGSLSAKVPVVVFFTETPSSTVTPSGYGIYYMPGTNPKNGFLRFTSAAGTELATGAYPAALLQANIAFEAIFSLGI